MGCSSMVLPGAVTIILRNALRKLCCVQQMDLKIALGNMEKLVEIVTPVYCWQQEITLIWLFLHHRRIKKPFMWIQCAHSYRMQR